MDISSSNGPGAILSLSIPHSDMQLYNPSDYSSSCLNDEVPCKGLPVNLKHLHAEENNLRVRCNGTAAAPSPTTGSTGEPEEKTSESEPDRSHSSHSEAAPADFDMEALPEEALPVFGESFRGTIVCNVDGVIGFLACDSVSKVWPRFSSSIIIDQSTPETTVPSAFFPFHTVALVPSSGSSVSFYECELPSSVSPHRSQALDLYQNLPLLFPATASSSPVHESHSPVSLYVCLLCPPIQFDSEITFLHHISTKHDLPFVRNFSDSFGAIAQQNGPNGEPVCSWLKPLPSHAGEFQISNQTEKLQESENEMFPRHTDSRKSPPVVISGWTGEQRTDLSFSEPMEPESAITALNTEAMPQVCQESKNILKDFPATISSERLDTLPLHFSNSLPAFHSEKPENLGVIRKTEEELVRPSVLSLRGFEQSEEADDNSLDSNSLHSYDPEDLTLHYRSEEHNHGHSNDHEKSSSVECPKCDIVLGSSKSLGGHMTMVHSRNSSKTLKCPKCNWHYKYQETLEIHMKEKHPDSEETCPYCLTGQSHPRLARGEVYSCGYKPYRCDICNYSTTSKGNLTIHMQSDKHVNNVQDRQKTGEVAIVERVSPTEDIAPQPIPRSSSNSSNRGPFRCDMCNYETNVSRNLRIHMTSDKHQQNANMVMQQSRRPDMTMMPSNGMGMFDATTMMQLMGMNAADMMTMQQAYMSSLTNGASSVTAPPPISADQNPAARTSSHIPRIPECAKVLQCLVCVHYQTDSLEDLREHIARDRSDDSDSLIMNGAQCVCKYCQYKTNLKANFQLHCKTDKHVQRMQLVNHVREGGTDNEWRLQYLNTSNPVQVRCNACDYQTTSLTQMRIHLESNEQHEVNRTVLFRVRDLQLETTAAAALPNINKSPTHLINASSALIPHSSTRKWKLLCSCCTFTSKSSAGFMQHMRSALHWRNFQSHNLDEKDTVSSSTNAHPDYTAFVSIKEDSFKGESGVESDEERDTSDGEGVLDERERALPRGEEEPERSSRPHPVLMCPLCQEPSYSRDRLKVHLTGKHKVDAGEALHKLMRLVETSVAWNEADISREPSPSSTTSEAEGDKGLHLSDINNGSSDISDVYRCQKCSDNFKNIEQLYAHQNEKCHLELKQTPRGPGYLCWKKGCNQYFKSKQSLQMHFTEIHARKAQAGANRSPEHQPDSDEASTPHTDENSQNGDGEMDDELNSLGSAESGYRDAARKYKCHRCKVAFTNQNYLTAHNKTPHHRKGEKNNYSQEKYMDPNRPYKCEVCRESFTQKNILLVHYNSVSHLHKLKKYRNQTENRISGLENNHEAISNILPVSQPSAINAVPKRPSSNSIEDDTKPYRCKVCKVAYANASNLDIHVRSVAHQSRVARAQNNLPERISNGMDLSRPLQVQESPSSRTPDRMDEEEEVVSLPHLGLEEKESVIQRVPASGSTSPTLISSRLRTFGRSKGNVGWMSMMENIGLEVVQHGLENGQKPVKKSKDTTLEPVEGENTMPDKSSLKNECQVCHKQFSSQWILKVHKESSHGDFIPSKILEAVASEYRKTIRADKPKQKRQHELELPKTTEKESPKKLKESQSTNISTNSPQPSTSSSANNYAADMMAAQAMQLFPLLYPGLGMAGMNMMNLQAAMMNLQPQLLQNNGQFSLANLEAMGLNHSALPDMSKGASSNAAKNFQLDQNGQKRNRTRITEEQQAILRANFDIKSSPSDELLQCLCEQTGLELKVVKHWYRNTLFKERQRNKDSPYNFNVPPNPNSTVEEVTPECRMEINEGRPSVIENVPTEPRREVREEKIRVPVIVKREKSVESLVEESSRSMRDSSLNHVSMSTPSPTPGQNGPHSAAGSISQHLQMNEDRGGGKRANRTRFTEFQIKALQDYFDRNAYPKDDDLEDLSRALDLQPRVITVWFQNARQKARKSYENTTPPEEEAPVIRTPSLNYQCKKCLQVFQKYYELIRHQRVQCSGTSAGLNVKDIDDACSVASASSISSSKLGSLKAELTNGGVAKMWDPTNTVPVTSVLAASPFMFPGLYPANSPFGMLQMEAISHPMAGVSQSNGSSPLPLSQGKRKASSDDEEDTGESGNKRVRTTIHPEQLDYLYQQYRIDSNPSRKQLEHIAIKSDLKKRVVQVWYQNTRARERKGALHLHQISISKRCPVCRLHFKIRTALEAHISAKHADVYCKGDVNVDELPDTDGGESADENFDARSTPSPAPRLPPKVPLPSTSASSSYMTDSSSHMTDSMQRFYEDAMKKYMANAEIVPSSQPTSVIVKASAAKLPISTDAPLDLSAPCGKPSPSGVTAASLAMLGAFNSQEDSYGGDQEGSDDEGSNAMRGDGSMSQSGRPGKRYRTQMSNAQLKVMKRLFHEYKTPSMVECENVGKEIGLQKRVVQVWFQNARAKEKKNRLPGSEPEKPTMTNHCPMCNVSFSKELTLQDHMFTKLHIGALKKSENCHDGPSTSSSMMARLTSPVPKAEREPVRQSVVVSNHAKKGSAEGLDRKHVSEVIQSASKKTQVKNEASEQLARTQSMQQMQQAAVAQAAMNPFGDLSAMMMTDPMMAYMYASMNPYYNPAAMMNPYAGMMYDPTVHGTALHMLQLPPGVAEQIFSKLNSTERSGNTSAVAFAQDGKRLSDLRDVVSASDFACATSSQSDIGSICRKCQTVFPTEASCKAHQTSVCYPGSKDLKNVLKLQQIHFHCTVCQKQLPTILDFKHHCSTPSHQKNKQGQATPSLKKTSSNHPMEERRNR